MLSVLAVGLFVPHRVSLHIERFSSKHNLLHSAISFSDGKQARRFDFRPFVPPGTSYETTALERLQYNQCMVDFLCLMETGQDSELMSKVIYWGDTNRTWAEVQDFEARLARRRYVLGVNDCRHYTAELALFATGKQTPIWDLHKLF